MSFKAKGKTCRYVNVDSQVTIDGATAPLRADGRELKAAVTPAFYTVDGYAPVSAQMMLPRHWKAHGRPPVMHTVPSRPVNDVTIELRGRDTIRRIALDRYTADGVVWGRDTTWLDQAKAIAPAITRAGGLGFEAVRDGFERAPVEFVDRATISPARR